MAGNVGLHAVAETTGQFGNNFLKTVGNDKPGNLIMSPLSAQVVLAMAAYGAGGRTATQMRSCLFIPTENEVGQSGYQSLIETLNAVKGVELRLANKIYTASQFEVKPEYKELTSKKFYSSSEEVDFNDPTQASKTINTWCEEKTNKRIKDLITEDCLNSDTKLVLVNAVYFKGQWDKKFNPALTKDRPFHIDEHTTKCVPTMFIKHKLRFGDLPELSARFIEIPYQGDELSMIIIVPYEVDGLQKIQDNLHQVNLKQSLQKSYPSDVELFLPKFKIESTLDLQETLEKLGMTDMFGEEADFSGISDTPLKVSKVIQKAFIEVNEEGSEAAAATGIMLQARCMIFSAELAVDHPFVYMIVSLTQSSSDDDGDIVSLFSGHVVDPSL
ncbi:serpin B6-like isoform X1 [Neodiprion virginianus]|uniref:serpin B6-like isoform X1 n=1 Tax=Neodiprion fabricii TaxID=2872261 RepID=UPI001ED91E46|nr:serpin B6-like isoform X1 [Neodiprion fabricii]XP_046429093.1 serpin B6-like isoform X1 [Neodiprion fabricii]XP_046621198.1 serpin B6-like isoform X1 [Neodiprion virginianus]XP_046621199.1 serpin B6-like isoform X1 [Neodiprion virginianus]